MQETRPDNANITGATRVDPGVAESGPRRARTGRSDIKPVATDETNRRSLQRVERKVNLLVALSAAQAVALVVLIVMSLIPGWTTIVFALLILAVFIALFHKKIPGWSGRFARFVFARLRAEGDESFKDSQQ